MFFSDFIISHLWFSVNNERSYDLGQASNQTSWKEYHEYASMWFYGVAVSTLDFESSDPSSNLGRTCLFFSLLDIFFSLTMRHIRQNEKNKTLYIMDAKKDDVSQGVHPCAIEKKKQETVVCLPRSDNILWEFHRDLFIYLFILFILSEIVLFESES